MVTAALLLARDIRTTLGRNITYEESLSNQDVWAASPQLVRSMIMEKETVTPSTEDAWRLPFLAKLIVQRSELHTRGMEEEKERVQELINSLCTS